MGTVLAANRRNLLALGAAAALLAGAYLFATDPVVRYAAWLTVFVVWMAWFVAAGIEWLSNADF